MRALPMGTEGRGSSRGRRAARLSLALTIWAVAATGTWAWMGSHEEGVFAGFSSLIAALEGSPFAPAGLALAFVVRPVTLLPVTVLTAFCGFLFGPVLGFAWATLAVVSTALIPYAFSRFARGRQVAGPVAGWRASLARRPFESVLTARLAMLPGDLVNVAAGLLHVPVAAFVGATAIGGSPGVLVGVLAGAGLQGAFRIDGASVAWPLVLTSAAVLGVSLVMAHVLRTRGRPAAD